MTTNARNTINFKMGEALIWVLFADLFLNVLGAAPSQTGEVIPACQPSDCQHNEYFNVLQLRCLPCSQDLNLQPSLDRLSCVCDDRSKLIAWNVSLPTCVRCSDNEVPTLDQRDCITCPLENLVASGNDSALCEHFLCPTNSLSLEREPSGTLLPRIQCVPCPIGTKPSVHSSQCEPCEDSCCENSSICPTKEELDWPTDNASYAIKFLNGQKRESPFLKTRLRKAIYQCQKKNIQACQEVANMCALVLYDDDYPTSPCVLFQNTKRIPIVLGLSHLPWIYYGDGDAPSVLSRRRITTSYTLNPKSQEGRLNFTSAIYSADGRLTSLRPLKGSELQLCPGQWHQLERSLTFLTPFKHACSLPASQLLHSRTTQFLDLFLSYQDGSVDVLHAVPILIRNFVENVQDDRTQWSLVRRFFMIDTISNEHIIRFASRLTLLIRLQGRGQSGRIYVPLLKIQYSELTADDVHEDKEIPLEFEVIYEMPGALSHTIEVSMGVVSALAVVWAGIRTWSHSKRSGRVAVDLYTLGHLVLFTCGYLANVFFLISFCTSVIVFVFFKGQSVVHVLLPSPSEEHLLYIYVMVAFFLKLVEMAYLVYSHVTLDIFLVDWERPRGGTDQPVSIWRTYFVANEWNEIQTKRKINLSIHLLLTIMVLKVAGLEHWASAEPQLHPAETPHLGIPSSFTCRFATGGLVYLVVYIIQWLLITLVYERYIKNGIQEFVDLCSMANISVFILTQARYGYYIHGRSAHGFADTDLLSIVTQLRREEEDLVGHRGLLPGTEQQTFEMIVPSALREYYNKVMAPLKLMPRNIRRPGRAKTGIDSAEHSVQAYHNMNRFLGAFLDHALKDLDYEVREKMFAEALLGIEFTDGSEKGILFSDSGHSFDQVLWYGNELALLTFDLIVFTFIQLSSGNFLLAAALTGIAAYGLGEIRRLGGRQNLAKKTLTDDRFLI